MIMPKAHLIGVLLSVLALVACDPTPEKIERWKSTERGPGKLRDTVKRSGLSPALRGHALVALVEIGMTQEALRDLEPSPPAERSQVVREAAPRLITLMKGDAVSTTRAEREAKDALYLLRRDAAREDVPKIDEALIGWTTADLAGRMQQGGQSTEKILRDVGAAAVPRLLELLRGDGPNQLQAAALIGQIGDAAQKARAAELLVEAARKTAQRTRDIPDPLLRAVAGVGGPLASAFLVEQAENGNEGLRHRALLALAQGASLEGDKAALAAALRLAADKGAPAKVRDAAFEVAEKTGAGAVAELVKLMNAPEELIRWRAVEAALQAGKAAAVGPVLEALSPARAYKPEDLDSYVVHDLQLVGEPAVPALKQALSSKNPIARVVAVRALARIGKPDDATALTALEADGTKLLGFPAGATVGSEAKAAGMALRSRHK